MQPPLSTQPVTGERHLDHVHEPSIADLVKSILGDVQGIIRSEVRLAKTELKEEGREAVKAGSKLALGGLLSLYGLLFVLMACMYGLAAFMPAGVAALIVGVAILGAAGLLAYMGLQQMRKVKVAPEKTIRSVKENIEWAKNQTR